MLRLNLFRDEQGEPRIWSHGINESAKKRPGAFPLKARWLLHAGRGCLGIEWSFDRRKTTALQFHIGEGDVSEVQLFIGIPFLLWFFATLEHPWLRRIVPTVRTKSYSRPGEYWDMPITRCVGFRIFGGKIWFDLWADPADSSHNRRWQQFSWGPLDFLFGGTRYSRQDISCHKTEIIMPEGRYPAEIVLFIARWKRPRLPYAKQIYKAEIEIVGGIPIPGKGDNSWDMEDNAIYSMTAPAATVHEAAQKLVDSAMRDRVRYAAVDWRPANGWPGHLIAVG